MESIHSKQKKMNKNLYHMYTFNNDKPNLTYIMNIPEDTNNKSNQKFDTCKYSARNYNFLDEEKLRQKYAKINIEDSVFKIKDNMNNIKKMDNEFKTYSNINSIFQNQLIETDEKLVFNNHSRLY
tara:strand:- start:842 stop:1216 length:375 start_codon:yes stop_codon:yes gene_type:complete